MAAITLLLVPLGAAGYAASTQARTPVLRSTVTVTTTRTVTVRVEARYQGRTAHGWRRQYRRRTRQLQNVRRELQHQPTVVEAINLACAVYGNCSTLWRKAQCESGLNPYAQNPSEASGLYQFLPSTWRSTPFGVFSIWSPYANALAAGWMHTHGRGGEWVCR